MKKCHICNKPVRDDNERTHYDNHSRNELVQYILYGVMK